MKVTLKLFATLSDYLPADAVRNQATLDLPEACTVGALIAQYGLPDRLVHLVLLNGNYLEPAARPERRLSEGDVLAIWPPVAGG